MTRHRCSVGNSYRSIAGSSTETINESIHTQSSFESVNNLLTNGPSSPESNINFNSQQLMISTFRKFLNKLILRGSIKLIKFSKQFSTKDIRRL